MPCLWISIFSSPEGLLGTIMHEAVQTFDGAANTFEVFNFQTEITNRDKDHVSCRVKLNHCFSCFSKLRFKFDIKLLKLLICSFHHTFQIQIQFQQYNSHSVRPCFTVASTSTIINITFLILISMFLQPSLIQIIFIRVKLRYL